LPDGTKKSILGKFLGHWNAKFQYLMCPFGIFTANWYFWPFGNFEVLWYIISPILVFFTSKNLASLILP
jgi:hypothetical protein